LDDRHVRLRRDSLVHLIDRGIQVEVEADAPAAGIPLVPEHLLVREVDERPVQRRPGDERLAGLLVMPEDGHLEPELVAVKRHPTLEILDIQHRLHVRHSRPASMYSSGSHTSREWYRTRRTGDAR